MPAILELGPISNGRDNRRGGLRTHPLDPGNALAGLTLTEYRLNLPVEDRDPAVEIMEQVIELSNGVAGHRCQFIVGIAQDLRDQTPGPGDALGHGKSTIKQEPTDLTDDGSPMIDHALPGTMQCLDVLLLDRLLRDKRDMCLACCRADGLGIVTIVLLATHKWLHVLRD